MQLFSVHSVMELKRVKSTFLCNESWEPFSFLNIGELFAMLPTPRVKSLCVIIITTLSIITAISYVTVAGFCVFSDVTAVY